jgi:hypothetical protein
MTFRQGTSGTNAGRMWLRACAAFIGALAVAAGSARGQCEAAKLLPGDAQSDDHIGYAVAVDGETIIVGAVLDDDKGVDAGAAYVYRRQGSIWIEEAKLLASDGQANACFGSAVAVDGDVAVIGAPGTNEADPEDPMCQSGSAYIFRFTDGGWTEEAKLLATEPECGDWFGWRVAFAGDVIAIGAPLDDDMAGDAGAVYVYRYDGSTWLWETTLQDPDGAVEDFFGHDVAICQDILFIGAAGDDEGAENTGSAFVYRHDGSEWILEQKLLASDGEADDGFAGDVAFRENMAVFGVSCDDDQGDRAGAAYVFRHDGAQWTEEAKLLASDGVERDNFGNSVDTNGSVIIVGALNDDDFGPHSGSAYVFEKEGGDWIERAKMLPADGKEGDQFGWSSAIDGETAVIGALMFYNDGPGAGYVFELDGPDCNENGICDPRDILEGTSCDINANGIPDECEDLCTGDVNADGEVNVDDLDDLLGMWGPCPPEGPCMADFICDGVINVSDLLVLLGHWGPCPDRGPAPR